MNDVMKPMGWLRGLSVLGVLGVLLFGTGCDSNDPEGEITIIEDNVGTGALVEAGKLVGMRFWGRVESGLVFDSTGTDSTFYTLAGVHCVIDGFDIGLLGMREGGRRVFEVPPELAYGEDGIPGFIPRDETITFEVEVLTVEAPIRRTCDTRWLAPEVLEITDLTVGTGATAVADSVLAVEYRGTLSDGTLFDESPLGDPFKFILGAGCVIEGWEEGIAGMKVGGKREITFSHHLGYGDRGVPGQGGFLIPPYATLTFEIELKEVSSPAVRSCNSNVL